MKKIQGRGIAICLLAGFTLLACHSVTGQQIKVMSYNIRFDNPDDGANAWEHRREYLISQIEYQAPDLVGTQEGLVHQLEAMDKGLSEYSYIGRGRDQGERDGEFAAVFYRTDRLVLESEGTFWLSETPSTPSRGWDAALNRVCTYGIFRLKETGIRFCFFNTHFDHIGVRAREESVYLILRKIKELNPEGLPVILTGDLNLEPDTPAITALSRKLGDARILAGERAFGPGGTFNGFDCSLEVSRRIDYIFVSQEKVKVLRQLTLSETMGTGYPSDHFAVIAELGLSESP